MRVLTPTSNEKIFGFTRSVDLASVLLAAPVAVFLRDPSLFTDARLAPTLTYCAIGFVAGLAMVILFRVGKSLGNHVSTREVKSVVLASLAAATLTASLAFSFDRLNLIPRSLPLIHLLVLLSFMLGGRMVALRRSKYGGFRFGGTNLNSQHVLVLGSNRITFAYLRMLEAFEDEATSIVGILDDNPELIGRSVFGHPVIAPVSALPRVVSEYSVHGVDIDRVLVAADRQQAESETWSKVETTCRTLNVPLEFLGTSLVVELGDLTDTDSEPVVDDPLSAASNDRRVKRAFDFSISLALAIVLSPIISLVALGILADLGWPILFWQKRVGYLGRPFLIFKFRTLHAPFDRHGEFVEEEKRKSRFGDFLRYTRIDELPQLWNTMTGDMSFVGPRPLLPVDQPPASKHRLLVRPGLTGWAQIHGGKQIDADEKGELDDWYVENASLRLDIWIIWRTAWIVFFGDKRIETSSAFVGSARKTASGGEGQLSGSQDVGALEDLISQVPVANDPQPRPVPDRRRNSWTRRAFRTKGC
jgi:lipopolysaccharide/colanic/teichoic acid biosynthesis glycosyltransferase